MLIKNLKIFCRWSLGSISLRLVQLVLFDNIDQNKLSQSKTFPKEDVYFAWLLPRAPCLAALTWSKKCFEAWDVCAHAFGLFFLWTRFLAVLGGFGSTASQNFDTKLNEGARHKNRILAGLNLGKENKNLKRRRDLRGPSVKAQKTLQIEANWTEIKVNQTRIQVDQINQRSIEFKFFLSFITTAKSANTNL